MQTTDCWFAVTRICLNCRATRSSDAEPLPALVGPASSSSAAAPPSTPRSRHDPCAISASCSCEGRHPRLSTAAPSARPASASQQESDRPASSAFACPQPRRPPLGRPVIVVIVCRNAVATSLGRAVLPNAGAAGRQPLRASTAELCHRPIRRFLQHVRRSTNAPSRHQGRRPLRLGRLRSAGFRGSTSGPSGRAAEAKRARGGGSRRCYFVRYQSSGVR